jgi:hypothetical protein
MLLNGRNAQQDHGICGGYACAFCGDGSIAGRAVHRYEHAESRGVSAGLLRKQSVLRHIASAHQPTGSARCKAEF